jgi:predicted glycoside hydrolase/deacetylase ChbG (UPF0249 family)
VNLFEGRPVSAPNEVDLLVDRHGRFRRGFTDLWAAGTAGIAAARLKGQIRLEVGRQIALFLEAFGDRGAFAINGHVHYHVLPPVFDQLMDLCAEHPLKAMRLPCEPLYWPFTKGAPRPPLVNVAKNLVLRTLSRRAKPALSARSVTTTDAFVGVLGTGEMTLEHVRAALDHLGRAGVNGTVEILFHPGRCQPSEAEIWSDRPELAAFYSSANRDREAALLCSAAFGELLRSHGATADHSAEAASMPEVSR